MKTQLIKTQLITLAQSATKVNESFVIRTDEGFNYVTGLLFNLVSGSISGLQIEIGDDFNTLFRFTSAENWVKKYILSNRTKLFRPCNISAKGRNIVIRVKADSIANETKIQVCLHHSHNSLTDLVNYNFEQYNFTLSYPFVFVSEKITLPVKYSKVIGIAAICSNNLANTINIALKDSSTALLESCPISLFEINENTEFDYSAYPLEFISKGKQIDVDFSKIHQVDNPPTSVNISLILTVS